ncbi:MAG TPA: tRNA 2-thiouridine(34) synthase MnmA [Synergistales bacterium]|nr:tRNA 2-thiouridine(34) synthase MnmA [Synergistales bacterium]
MVRKVILGISGGIDSAVAAYLLMNSGFEVEGVHLSMTGRYDPEQLLRVRKVSEVLHIPVHEVDRTEEFSRKVITPFARDYLRGITPNPCVMCNPTFKFEVLFDTARSSGAEMVATGHFARISGSHKNAMIKRAMDHSKDQSYMLYRLPREYLSRTVFPLGDILKSKVRNIGLEVFGNILAGQRESQDICFLKKKTLRELLLKVFGEDSFPSGPVYNTEGEEIGRHKGVFGYTIGQRKGLALPGGPWYVVSLDASRNSLVVGREKDIFSNLIKCISPVWHMPVSEGQEFTALHRYRTKPVKVMIRELCSDSFTVETRESFRAPAPGQSLVLYSGDSVAGGGLINFSKREE